MNKSDLKLDWCSYQAAKYATEKWHYSGNMPVGKLNHIGVWEKGAFIGGVVFGYGNNQYQGHKFNITQDSVCELLRVSLREHCTSVTRIISVCINLLKRKNPGLRLIVSYADPEHGHIGGIYQGGNWTYCGRGGSGVAYYDETGKRLHSRVVGKGGMKSHFGKMTRSHDSDTVESRPLMKKHKYLYPLDDAMRKQIEPLRKPYPKRGGSDLSDTPGVHPGEGGSIPTPPLQVS